jgi:hypothetical protein
VCHTKTKEKGWNVKGCFDELIKKAQSLEDLGNLIKEAEKAEKAEDPGLVRFGELEVNDWFEYDSKLYIKQDCDHGRERGKSRAWRGFSRSCYVRPVEVEIRKKMPGEVVVEIDSGDVCCVLSCDNCPVGREDGCHCHRYTWTLTGTPKTPKKG